MKPLTKEEREEIRRIVEPPFVEYDAENPAITVRYLASLLVKASLAEKSWREAVKGMSGHSRCPFRCDPAVIVDVMWREDLSRHKPDCPWLLAQE